MRIRLFILFLCFVSCSIQALQVIIVMGPSCAGKSTLSKYLCDQLNTQNEKWEKIDFDDVEENIERLIAVTNDYLQQNSNVIIDTNTYENGLENRINGAVTITKIIVIAPLEVLLQRDKRRTEFFNRNADRALRCRDFVIDSFNRSLTWIGDLIIDSSCQSVQVSCEIILDFLKL
ncbi:MAG TPA: ATP-binding cassette domain-containing protein [Candidatus Babeliales bacterium]|jgi:predicted AAA+ superfamily ATPase|nr:ATP-binding cassette domain-containing protein [Candidatus Babeliales bacterium]